MTAEQLKVLKQFFPDKSIEYYGDNQRLFAEGDQTNIILDDSRSLVWTIRPNNKSSYLTVANMTEQAYEMIAYPYEVVLYASMTGSESDVDSFVDFINGSKPPVVPVLKLANVSDNKRNYTVTLELPVNNLGTSYQLIENGRIIKKDRIPSNNMGKVEINNTFKKFDDEVYTYIVKVFNKSGNVVSNQITNR